MKKIITSDDIEQLLRNRFCPPAWVFLPQVRNGTGYLRLTRTADALAMSLYPSRGLHLYGFEIKVRRGDWLNELKNPKKAEAIAQFCDFFWIVAPKDVVKIEEVPHNWGLMIPYGATTKIIKKAELLKPVAIDRLLLASILRKAQSIITPEARQREIYKKGIIEGRDREKNNFKWERERHETLQKTIQEFEKKSGVHISQWNYENIGESVRMVLNGDHLRVKEELTNLLQTSRMITKNLEERLEKL